MDILLLCAAVWRISYMLVTEDGPFDILRSIRKAVRASEFGGETIDADRLTPQELEQVMMMAATDRSLLGKLLSCVYCTSVWVAAIVVLLYWLLPGSWWLWLLFATSAAAIFLQEILERIKR